MRKNKTKYLFFFLFFAYLFVVYDVNFRGPDEPIYFAYTQSVVEDGDLNAVNQFSKFNKVVSKTYNLPDHRNHGGVVLWLPFYSYAKSIYYIAQKLNLIFLTSEGFERVSKSAMSFSTIVFGFLVVILTYKFCRLFFSERISVWSTSIVFFGTSFFYYTLFETGNPNILACLFSVLSVWVCFKMVEMKKVHWFLFGSFFAIGTISKLDIWFQLIYITSFFIMFCISKQLVWRRGVYFLFGFLSMYILRIINDYLKSGVFYIEELLRFKPTPYFDGFFSAYRGMFYTSPILYLCVLGYVVIVISVLKKMRNKSIELKNQDVFLLILTSLFIVKVCLLHSVFVYGNDLLTRFLLTEFPLCVLLYARAIQNQKQSITYFIGITSVPLVIWNWLIHAEYITFLDWAYITSPQGIDTRVANFKYILNELFLPKDLNLKFKLWLPLVLIVFIFFLYSKLRAKKPLLNYFSFLKRINKNKFLQFFSLFTGYLCIAYIIVTALNITNNKRNVKKLKTDGFFENVEVVNPSQYEKADPLGSSSVLMRYYGLKGDVQNMSKIEKYLKKYINIDLKMFLYPELPQPYCQIGDLYKKMGEYSKAIEFYRNFLRIYPNNIDAYMNLGDIYLIKGEYDKAIESFSEIIKLNPNYIHAYYRLGSIYYKINRYEEAEEMFIRAFRVLPSSGEALLWLGEIYTTLGKCDGAIAYFEKYIKFNPFNAENYRKVADLYGQKGNYEKRIEYLQKAYERNPKLLGIYYSLANTYSNMGNFSKAIEYFNKSILYDASNSDAYSELGYIYKKQGENPKAIKYLEKAVKLNPNSSEIYLYLGDVYRKQGNYGKAKKNFEKTVELNPNNPEIYLNLGDIYKKQGDYNKAIKNFDEAVGLNPSNSDIYLNLGDIYKKQGDYVAAIKNFEKAAELNPNNSDIYINLGDIHIKQGDYVAAIKNFEKAAELNPNNPDIYLNLGDIYKKQGDYVAAIKNFEKATELNPNNPDIYLNLGDIYKKQGDYNQAIKYLEKAIELDASNPKSYFDVAETYQNEGNYNKASEYYRQSLKLNPNFIDAYNGLQKVNYRIRNRIK